MLKFFRKHTKTWFVWVLFSAIIVVFVFWGIGTMRSRRADFVAKIDDQVVTRADFQKAYNNAVKNYQNLYGDALSEDVLKKLNVEKVVFDGLVTQCLTENGAKSLGVRVSDDEVKEYIRNMPVFSQEGGGFSEERYLNVLKNARLTPAEFESGIKKEFLQAKVSEVLGRFAKVSDAEVLDAFRYANRQIKLAYVAFKANAFQSKVAADGPALQRYFKAHEEEYRVPAKVKVHLAHFLFKDYAEKVKISPAEIEAYYKDNTPQFREPEKRRISHVFFAVKPSAAPEETSAIEKKAQEVMNRAKAGENFTELVKQFSEDRNSIKSEGDLGYLRRGMTDAGLEDAVFSMQKGEISQIIRSKSGLHVIKLTEIVPSRNKELSEVSSDIQKLLMNQRTQELAKNEAEREYGQIMRSGGLARHAGAARKSLAETPFFSESEEVPGVGRDVSFTRAVLALKKGEISSLIKTPQGYFIAEVIDKKESFIPTLNDIKAQLTSNLVRAEALRLAEAEATKFISEITKGTSFPETASKYSLPVKETNYFKPTAPSGVEFLSARTKEIAVLTPASPVLSRAIKAGESYYVATLIGTQDASKELFAAQNTMIRESLLRMQKDALLKGWLEGLKKKAKIETAEEFQKYM